MPALTLPNIHQIKDDYPGVYEDLEKLRKHVNLINSLLGGVAAPVAAGGITITAANGVIDVQIIDKHPEQGEEYFLNYDTQPSFATAHDFPMLSTRNHRFSNLAGLTTYWRWYKSTKLGGISGYVVYGNPPTAVTPGNLSTTTPGPVPGPAQGSGQTQIPGYGYGGPVRGGRGLPNSQ